MNLSGKSSHLLDSILRSKTCVANMLTATTSRFEREKVEDFKSGVETFLEGCVEAQKELIELWETYLYQLDTDEDGPPSVMPAGVRADADGKAARPHLDDESTTDAGTEDESARLSGTTARESEDVGVPERHAEQEEA